MRFTGVHLDSDLAGDVPADLRIGLDQTLCAEFPGKIDQGFVVVSRIITHILLTIRFHLIGSHVWTCFPSQQSTDE